VTQRVLRRHCIWTAPGGELDSLSLAYYGGEPCAFVAGPTGVHVVSLKTPARPALRESIAEARGAMPFLSGLLTWTDSGLFCGERPVHQGRVLDVQSRKGYLYVRLLDQIQIWDSSLALCGKMDVKGPIWFAAVGPYLALADSDGIKIFDLANPATPKQAGSLELDGVVGMSEAAVAGLHRSLLVELDRQRFVVVEVDNGKPGIAAQYASRPWFAGAAALGDLVARSNPAGYMEVYTRGMKTTTRF
jgi:hypothetical protein